MADEETGRCVGNFKVAIRRRWNYENNVAEIVCYLSAGKYLVIKFIFKNNINGFLKQGRQTQLAIFRRNPIKFRWN